MDIRKTVIRAAIALAAVTAAGAAQAIDRTGGDYNTIYAGIGIKGYDPVAYFTDGKPVMGNREYEAFWGGVTWNFASAEHRDLFQADPEKYAPQFGAFCSWGVSQGKLFDVDPVNAWEIVDGRLYLNFNQDIQDIWSKNPADFIAKAEGNWPTLNQ
jgi:YHS domain-containing protein